MMTRILHIFAIAGSLRKGSYNKHALSAVTKVAPDGMSFDVYDRLAEIPAYDEDVRAEGYPSVVQDLRRRIAAADGLLFATPEYNYSVPGVLKNAIDWASRPPDQPFAGKPVAIMSASISIFGGARAQYHLRQSLVYLDAFPINQPEVMIPSAADKFDETGNLTDKASRDFIAKHLQALADWTDRLKC